MTVRRLAVVAVAALAALPASPALAASGTADLPKALADPLETGFVELTGSSTTPVGYFDAAAYSSWAGRNANSRDYFRNQLTSNGFVTGYQRFWYMTGSTDVLFETVFVLKLAQGADAMLSETRRNLSQSASFKQWVPLQLNAGSFSLEEANSDGYSWTFAGFSKSNDVFELFRGSKSNYQPAAAIAQARQMFSVAPNGTSLASAQAHESALAQFRTPLIIIFLAGALLIAVALVIAVLSTITLPRAAAARLQ